MSKHDFGVLCTKMQDKIGKEKFHPSGSKVHGVCEKNRVVIGLYLLCGGSYLDLLGRAYGVNYPM